MHVALQPPLDINSSLQLFQRSGDDLLDRWDGSRLARAVPVDDHWVPFVAHARGSPSEPAFLVESPDPAAVAETVANTFVPPPPEYAVLLHTDPVLRRLDEKFRGICQIRQLDLFTALIRCISAQQVNLRWAVITRRRLAEAFGTPHEVNGTTVYSLDPHRLAAVDPADIRALQFTTSKAVSIVAVARAIVDGHANLDELRQLSDDEVIARLVSIRGIGRWSAEWVLARTLGRAVVVAGDLGVRKAVGLAYLGTTHPSEADVRRATAHWGNAAGTAQALLLHALGEHALPGA
ncbi:MAG: DNA-3-methyladenine glycosylase 2 family protein [Chloroflexi bacterium]|nr:DNA-3-methyladenine glycosylase 2 family protein [Chloroflexota bacterium]